jgi:Amiloride-sensitive sodium channel
MNLIKLQFFICSTCSVLAVGYENDHFHSFIKSHMFGTSELLASIGGFLSLIGGISVISLFEIFYFLGCRNLRKNSKENLPANQFLTESSLEKSSCFKFLKKYSKFSSIHGLSNAAEGKVFG